MNPTILIPDFGVFHNVSDDSYRRGYTEGNAAGHNAGYETGLQEGYQAGREEGYADGQQAGYEAGQQAGYAEGQLSGIEQGRQAGYAEGQLSGIEQGRQAEYDRFWDAFQQNGDRSIYHYAFARWPDACYDPKHPICPQHAGEMFANSEITDIYRNGTVIVDFSNATAMSATFQGANKLKELGIIDMRKVASNTYNTFTANNLEKIGKIILTDDGQPIFYPQTFTGAYKLSDIAFEGAIFGTVSFVNSPLLTDASVQNIIDHLKNLTGEAAQTLTFHATVGAKLTDAQKAAITAKNWTLVY